MHFFGGKKTNPSGLVEMLVDNFTSLIASKEKESEVNKKSEKAVDFDRNLNTLCKKFLDLEPSCEIVAQLCHEIYSHDLIILMIKAIPFLDFENRKETVGILSYLLHRQVGVRMPTVDYMLSKPDSTVFELLRIYPNAKCAINIGTILRMIAKNYDLCRMVIYSEQLYQFFEIIQCQSFDVSSDAFEIFSEFLTAHKQLSHEFLTTNYDKFFSNLNVLVESDNYVIVRQSLVLTGKLLLQDDNREIRQKYIGSESNLKQQMNLLRNKAKNIRFEAFHIFKIFVANPAKQKPIVDILFRNKSKLIEFLQTFGPVNEQDEQFQEEKEYVIKCISELTK